MKKRKPDESVGEQTQPRGEPCPAEPLAELERGAKVKLCPHKCGMQKEPESRMKGGLAYATTGSTQAGLQVLTGRFSSGDAGFGEEP